MNTRKQGGHSTDELLRCARMYYRERLHKKEIAKLLGYSATQVGRLLDEAEERGVVRIIIDDAHDHDHLAAEVAAAYRLSNVAVATSYPGYEEQKMALGSVAAAWFERVATPGARIGMGGGGSLHAMTEAVAVAPRDISLVPMALVGRGPDVEHYDATFLVSRLHAKCAPLSRAYSIGMLPLPADSSAREQFMKLVTKHIPQVTAVLKMARACTTSFVGLGGPEAVPELVPVLQREGLSLPKLRKLHAAGGINYSYFDEAGNAIAQFFKTVSILELQAMVSGGKSVVLVAGGSHKVAAIAIALRHAMVNHLITDANTAAALVAAARGQR